MENVINVKLKTLHSKVLLQFGKTENLHIFIFSHFHILKAEVAHLVERQLPKL
jgi:hypothetical protein